MTEDDEARGERQAAGVEDNSLGRLFALSDGIFAIAMTLLTLDLVVPDIGDDPSNAHLMHALRANSDNYFSYFLTFYVIASYWNRHRKMMRAVDAVHPRLIRDTMALLFLVAAMPFPASLLGKYSSEAISLALYGFVNALATITLLVMSRDIRRLGLTPDPAVAGEDDGHQQSSLVIFILCIPAGYVAHGHGAIFLLALPAVGLVRRGWRMVSARRAIPA